MKLIRERDVLELLTAYMPSAALSAALQLGLFWELAEHAMSADEVSKRWDMPLRRTQHWMNMLTRWGLLEKRGDTYGVSPLTRSAILDTYSRETWQFIAQREHAHYPVGTELAQRIQTPGSLWDLLGRQEPSDYDTVAKDPDWAARYTRMVFERTRDEAERFALQLDMTGVRRILDLGGGSGVVSFALLRRYPEVTSVVMDLENACAVGRGLAAEQGLAERITYQPGDIFKDVLPQGFDLALESDVGLYDVELFRRVRECLNPGGRFVINQPWAEPDGTVPERLILRNFRNSLQDPNSLECLLEDVQAMMLEAGFCNLTQWTFGTDDVVLEGRAQG